MSNSVMLPWRFPCSRFLLYSQADYYALKDVLLNLNLFLIDLKKRGGGCQIRKTLCVTLTTIANDQLLIRKILEQWSN